MNAVPSRANAATPARRPGAPAAAHLPPFSEPMDDPFDDMQEDAELSMLMGQSRFQRGRSQIDDGGY